MLKVQTNTRLLMPVTSGVMRKEGGMKGWEKINFSLYSFEYIQYYSYDTSMSFNFNNLKNKL